jgi:FkbM family methyltransferase
LLENNHSINKNVSIIHKAIYSYDGEIEFWEQPGISVVSSIDYTSVIGTSDRIKKVIECITPNTLINNYIKEESIDLLKIDIEGAEYEVFKSFDDESMNKIKRFLIEFHLNEDYRVMEIIEKLAINGFKYKFDKWNKLDDSDFIPQNKMGVIYAWK